MKIQTLVFCLLITGTTWAQSVIHFDKTGHNFGKIKKGVHKSVNFNFENVGVPNPNTIKILF